MIGGNSVIEDNQSKPFLGFVQPGDPFPSIADKLQQELLLVTTVRDVPRVPGNEIAIGSGHVFLNGPFRGQKHASKPQKQSDIQRIFLYANNLVRSDPGKPPVSPGMI